MVSPVNGDKPVSPSTERSGGSHKSNQSQQVVAQPGTTEHQASETASTTLEVDKARQLYEMESQKNRALASAIDTPEAARSLLDRIVNQFGNTPEQAFKSQASGSLTPLANLLEAAPA